MTNPHTIFSAFLRRDVQALEEQLRSVKTSVTNSYPRSPQNFLRAPSTSPLIAKDAFGRTILHVLASSSNQDFALQFLSMLDDQDLVKKADIKAIIDLQDYENGWTALHRALYAGNLQVVKILDLWGADSTIKDHEGLAPYDLWNLTIRGALPEDDETEGTKDLFMWGTNRNYVLGLGGDKDRAVPENVLLKKNDQGARKGIEKFQTISILQVSMAKLHTLLITDEPLANIYICGFTTPTQGRLANFTQPLLRFTPLPFRKRVIAVSAAADHSVFLTSDGMAYTFGSNKQYQLGYKVDGDDEVQYEPRRILGILRKEQLIGVAAGNCHTVVYSHDACWTWGTNKGQLGYTTSSPQITPRKVSSITEPIRDVKVTEYATLVLLENHVVYLFYSGQQIRVNFPHRTTYSTLQHRVPTKKLNTARIYRIAACGITFACVSTDGEVYRFSLEQPVSQSTVNPVTIVPKRVWTLHSRFSAACDVAVGIDGQLLICNNDGHVFMMRDRGNGWKWNRIRGLQRIVNVWGNSTGAWASVRRLRLGNKLFRKRVEWGDELWDTLEWTPAGGADDADLKVDDDDDDDDSAEFATSLKKTWDLGKNLRSLAQGCSDEIENGDMIIVSSEGKQWRVHSTVLMARCCSIRDAVNRLSTIPDITFKCRDDGSMEIGFTKSHSVTVVLFIRYLYTDHLATIWDQRVLKLLYGHDPDLDINPSDVRVELQTLATTLGLVGLEPALSTSNGPNRQKHSISSDFEALLQDPSLAPPDVILKLKEGEVLAHKVILSARCPFFGLLFGDEGWTMDRTRGGNITIDLQHIPLSVARLILRHIYTGEMDELFDSIEVDKKNQFLDSIVEILAVSDELLLDDLKLGCGDALISLLDLGNCVAILSEADCYHMDGLKQVVITFICCHLETTMELGLLDDATNMLLRDISLYAHKLQYECSPRSRRIEVKEWVASMSDLVISPPVSSLIQTRTSPGTSPSVAYELSISQLSPPLLPKFYIDTSPLQVPPYTGVQEQFLLEIEDELNNLPPAITEKPIVLINQKVSSSSPWKMHSKSKPASLREIIAETSVLSSSASETILAPTAVTSIPPASSNKVAQTWRTIPPTPSRRETPQPSNPKTPKETQSDQRVINFASGIGAPVISPHKMLSRPLNQRSDQGSAWNNYTTTYSSLPRSESSATSSFAIIQAQQQYEGDKLKDKITKSLRDIQAEEDEERKRKEEQRNFERWFEEESRRVQAAQNSHAKNRRNQRAVRIRRGRGKGKVASSGDSS